MLACFFTLSVPLQALDLAIEFPALERILAQQVFTQDGRRYVRGAPKDRCNYAYLEHPQIGCDNGRLRVQAHFSGRTAAEFFTRCIGLGDDFDLVITATPVYREGKIAFEGVKVESPNRDGFYIRRTKAALAQTLSRDFRYSILDDARRILEEKRPNAPFMQHMDDFHVAAVRVTPAALVVSIELTLVVR
ncbi:MAG: hypothetical protein JO022_10950 [Acidobacteriaceae bacterium]|nr:hypothetical protein [Acidobacteriaceae bacterium]